MKECMIEASACYRKSGTASTTSKAAKRATKKTASSKKATYRGAAALSSSNPWISHMQAYRASHGGVSTPHPTPPVPASAWTQHLAAYRASHPSKSMKECMIEASACYRKSGATASKAVKSASRPSFSSPSLEADSLKRVKYRAAAAVAGKHESMLSDYGIRVNRSSEDTILVQNSNIHEGRGPQVYLNILTATTWEISNIRSDDATQSEDIKSRLQAFAKASHIRIT